MHSGQAPDIPSLVNGQETAHGAIIRMQQMHGGEAIQTEDKNHSPSCANVQGILEAPERGDEPFVLWWGRWKGINEQGEQNQTQIQSKREEKQR